MKLAVIEGFFGLSWKHKDQNQVLDQLHQVGIERYLYAPKSESSLRKDWQNNQIISLPSPSALPIGIGLSPFELHLNPSTEKLTLLEKKIASYNSTKPAELAILFDDMRGDIKNLAQIQADIAHRALEATNAKTLLICPSYYSEDPVLDKVFGQRPDNYLEDLGRLLDPSIEIFWTGSKVCSTEYSDTAIAEVTEKLRRKPTLWDNYPVNDGAKMCKFLHLRGFENRRNLNDDNIAGHYINPMNQAWLSLIPIATLKMNYEDEIYCPERAADTVIDQLFGQDLACELKLDRHDFQYRGLDGLAPDEKQRLKTKYVELKKTANSDADRGACTEIIDWLNDVYAFDPACLTD